MWKRWWTLFRRELAVWRGLLLTVCALILVWDLYLASRPATWDEELIRGLVLVPMILAFPWALLVTIESWQREWREGTIHLTLSLDVPPSFLLSAKVAAAMLQSFLLASFIGACAWPFWSAYVRTALDLRELFLHIQVFNAAKGLLFAMGLLLMLCALAQLAYVASRMVRRLSWVAMPVSLVVLTWASIRLATLIHAVVGSWMPNLTFWSATGFGRVYQLQAQAVSIGPLVSACLLAFGAVTLGAWLMAQQMDV